jgi:hypothetical protein
MSDERAGAGAWNMSDLIAQLEKDGVQQARLKLGFHEYPIEVRAAVHEWIAEKDRERAEGLRAIEERRLVAQQKADKQSTTTATIILTAAALLGGVAVAYLASGAGASG